MSGGESGAESSGAEREVETRSDGTEPSGTEQRRVESAHPSQTRAETAGPKREGGESIGQNAAAQPELISKELQTKRDGTPRIEVSAMLPHSTTAPLLETRRRRRWQRVRRKLQLLSAVACLLILVVGVVRRLTVRHAPPVTPVVPPPIPPSEPLGPPGIVLHHSESPAVYRGVPLNAARLDDIHHHDHPDWATVCNGKTYYIAYHYVILPNGTIEQGRPENCIGTHARTHNDWLGICLIGGFQTNNHWYPERPTKQQMTALIGLCERLMSKYHIPPDLVKRHRDINDTYCPGDRFPYNFLLTQLRGYAATHPETRPISNRVVSLAHPPPPGRKKKKKTPTSNTLKDKNLKAKSTKMVASSSAK